MFWLIISGFQIFTAKQQSAHQSLVISLQVCTRLICLLLRDSATAEQSVVTVFTPPPPQQRQLSTQYPWHCLEDSNSKGIYICLSFLCIFFQLYYVSQTCDNFNMCTVIPGTYARHRGKVCVCSHRCFTAALSIERSMHTQRCGPEESLEQQEGATVSQTPFLPFALQIKPLLPLLQMRAAVLVGSSRWRAEEQCHPPPAPPSPHAPQRSRATILPGMCQQGAVCSCMLAIWPGLTLFLSGNKVRRHPVAAGLSQAGRKACTGSHWSASGLHDVNAHMPLPLFPLLPFNSNCSHQPVSLQICHSFQRTGLEAI